MPNQTPAQTVAEAQKLLSDAFVMDEKSTGNKGNAPRLMMERAKTLAFIAVAQSVGDMVAAAAETGTRPSSDKLLGALMVLQAAVTPPVSGPPAPTPSPPASSAPAVTVPAVTVPTPPAGPLLTTYGAGWSDGYRAAHPTSWSAGYTAAWPTAFAAGYRAGHPAGFATGVTDEAAALLRLLAAALAG